MAVLLLRLLWLLQLSRELEAAHQEHSAQLASLTQQAEEQRSHAASERAQAQVKLLSFACRAGHASSSFQATFGQCVHASKRSARESCPGVVLDALR